MKRLCSRRRKEATTDPNIYSYTSILGDILSRGEVGGDGPGLDGHANEQEDAAMGAACTP